jgi:hypothetical protein
MLPTNFKLAKLIQLISTTIIELRVKLTNQLIAEIANPEQRQQYLSVMIELSQYEQQIINRIKTFEFGDDTDFELVWKQISLDLKSIEHA